MRVILGSQSKWRFESDIVSKMPCKCIASHSAGILRRTGLEFETMAADIDEKAINVHAFGIHAQYC